MWMHFMETMECKMNSLPWWMAKRKSCNCPAVWETVRWPGKQRLELSNRNNRKDGLQFQEFCPGIIFSHGPMTLKTCPEQTLKELRSKQTETKAGAEYVETIERRPIKAEGQTQKVWLIFRRVGIIRKENLQIYTKSLVLIVQHFFAQPRQFVPCRTRVTLLVSKPDRYSSVRFGINLAPQQGRHVSTEGRAGLPCRLESANIEVHRRWRNQMTTDNKNMVCFTLKTESHRLIVWVTCDHTSMAIWWPCDCMPSPFCHLNRSYCGRSSRKRPMSFLLFMCCWEKIRGKVATFNRWTSARDNVPINRSIIQLKW